MMSGEKYPTASSYLPVINIISEKCKTLISNHYDEDLCTEEREFANALLSSLTSRFAFVNIDNEPLLFAMLLDPRYKFEFINLKDDIITAKIKLKWKTINLWKKYKNYNSSSDESDNEPTINSDDGN